MVCSPQRLYTVPACKLSCKQENRTQGVSAIGQDHPWAQWVRQGTFGLPVSAIKKQGVGVKGIWEMEDA